MIITNCCQQIVAVEDVKKMWSRLRDRFGRERKKMTKTVSGSAGGVKSVWPHMQAMEFVRPYIIPRRYVEPLIEQSEGR